MSSEQQTVVCTLTTKAAAQQVVGWEAVRRRATAVTLIDAGARMEFPSDEADRIEFLVVREQQCCAFLTIRVEHSADAVTVEMTADSSDGVAVARFVAGVADDGVSASGG